MLKFTPIAVAPSYTPLPSTPFTDSVQFQWNVEGYAAASMNFTYEIGEGPLYWYRVEWELSKAPCPISQTCMSMTPLITYTENPNCPSEITPNCTVMPSSCSETISNIKCNPGECIPSVIQIWHLLATSVEHLCYRINNECCQSKPKGFMTKVQKFDRPALCCDVENAENILDVYTDVDFINECQCGNLVHPGLASIIYDCNINNCGINGQAPSTSGGSSMMTMAMIPDSIPVNTLQAFQLLAPKQIELKTISNKFGKPIPELIYCNHNLNTFNFLKDVLKTSRTALIYDKSRDHWRGTENVGDWKILLEWAVGYKFNLIIDRNCKGKNFRTKLVLNVKDGGKVIDFNAKSGILKSKGVVQSKIIEDTIGLLNELKIKMEY